MFCLGCFDVSYEYSVHLFVHIFNSQHVQIIVHNFVTYVQIVVHISA